MSYLSIIPIQSAKDYLGLDDTARDAEVQRMIYAAIKYVEKETNHILEVQDKTYVFQTSTLRVYDYPINTVDVRMKKPLYSEYDGNAEDELTLNVGYANTSDIPPDLVEAIYGVLKFYFFEQEGSGKMPQWIKITLDIHRRFII